VASIIALSELAEVEVGKRRHVHAAMLYSRNTVYISTGDMKAAPMSTNMYLYLPL
jgi:hypothetical protein